MSAEQWRPGMVLGAKYVLVRVLGSGGTATVFEAQNSWTGRRVALKLLDPRYTHDPVVVARFVREARVASRVAHPNLVQVLDAGQEDSDQTLFLVEEFLEGTSLREELLTRGRLPADEAIELTLPVMNALVALHRAGVVHRDVKPENIVLARGATGEPAPKLIDFGISKVLLPDGIAPATAPGELLGTPGYMSPEQAAGQPVDERADVWAVGVLLYELLAGRPPFEDDSDLRLLVRVLQDPIPPLRELAPDVAPPLVATVHRALARERDERFPSMRAMVSALLACANPSVRHALVQAGFRHTPTAHGASDRLVPAATAAPERLHIDVAEGDREARVARRAADKSERRDTSPSDPALDHVRAAERAFEVNDLAALEASVAAGLDVATEDETRGLLALIRATACQWQGRHEDAERDALAACEALAPGSARWFDALGELAAASGALGRVDRLAELATELAHAASRGPVAAPHVVAACKLAPRLLWSGRAELAEQVLAAIQTAATDADANTRAWTLYARAHLAQQRGDLGTALRCSTDAAVGFAAAGEPRSACRQRLNVGDVFKELGAYAEAAEAFREVLAAADAMELRTVATLARANLGAVLIRLGAPSDEPASLLARARDDASAFGNARLESFARAYLVEVRWAADDANAAEVEARAAVAVARAPDRRAHALAVLADTLLRREHTSDAVRAAREAASLLDTLGGIAEGEALIRLTLASALYSAAKFDAACETIELARDRLRERGRRIADASWRASFYQRVWENRATFELAAAWLGDERA